MIHRLRMLRAAAERIERLREVAANSAVRAREARGNRYEHTLSVWASEDIGRLREAIRRYQVRKASYLADFYFNIGQGED